MMTTYLVKQENLRAPDETAGKGDKLTLTLREVLTTSLIYECRGRQYEN